LQISADDLISAAAYAAQEAESILAVMNSKFFTR